MRNQASSTMIYINDKISYINKANILLLLFSLLLLYSLHIIYTISTEHLSTVFSSLPPILGMELPRVICILATNVHVREIF